MYCINCGTKIEDGNSFCTNCGTKVENVEIKKEDTNNTTNVNSKKVSLETEEERKSAHTLCILSLVLYFGASIIGAILSLVAEPLAALSPLSNLAGIVLMIVARVKYPNNTFAKVLMWVYISLIAISIILIVVIVVACTVACSGLGDMG